MNSMWPLPSDRRSGLRPGTVTGHQKWLWTLDAGIVSVAIKWHIPPDGIDIQMQENITNLLTTQLWEDQYEL
jgi:hypothetical protein